MSLYRKYRPKSFADVVGQEHIVTTLERAVQQGNLAHAYLFAGPRGTGKTTIARILAKILLTNGIGDEVLQKQIIRAVDEENLVDLLEIDAASYTQVEHIRDLIEKIQFSPVVASTKVYVIDEAHMLSKSSFNALLKTLEEPPDYAYFILATTEIQKIPPTIQSRCQRFPFRPIREEDLIRRLQYIADQEHIVADRPALRAIARHAQGSVRDAISLLDQLRALEKIALEDVKERIGETGQEDVEAILAALDAKDRGAILEIIRRLEESGVAFETLLRQILSAIRQQLHEAIAAEQPSERLRTMLDLLLEAIRDVRVSPLPGLIVESTLLTLCAEEGEGRTERRALLSLRRKKEEPAAVREMESPAPPPKVEDEKGEALVEAPDFTLESVQTAWRNIINAMTPAAVKMSLKNSRVAAIKGATVTLTFASAFHRDKVSGGEASRRVEEALANIFRRKLKLECTIEEEGQGAPAPDEKMVNLAEAAAEIF